MIGIIVYALIAIVVVSYVLLGVIFWCVDRYKAR
jgi:hypothetical protein